MSELHDRAKNTPRRLHPRRRLMPVAQIELGDIAGTLLNVSEGGLALQSALVLWWGEQHDARFQLPGSPTWINARARVLRLSESKKEAGLEFVQISEESKAQIRE